MEKSQQPIRIDLLRRAKYGKASFFCIFVLTLLLRWYHIDYLSLWGDELFSRYYYELMGPSYMLGPGLIEEPTPPLYYFLLECWMGLFGGSETGMRSLSVTASLLAGIVAYLLGEELGGRRLALLGMLLFALCPTAIFYAQEARTYALTTAVAGVALLGIAHLLREPCELRGFAYYFGGALVATYLHATMVFFVAACGLSVLCYLPMARMPSRGRVLVSWVGTNAALAVLALPELFFMLQLRRGPALAWSPPLSIVDLASSVTVLVSGVATVHKFPGFELTALLLLTLAACLWTRPPEWRALITLVAVPMLFYGLVVLASLSRPILMSRTLTWNTLPLCLALAYGMLACTKWQVPLRALTCLTFAVGLGYQLIYPDNQKEPWRDVVHEIARRFRPGDVVVVNSLISAHTLGFRYYGPDLTAVREWNEQPDDQPTFWRRMSAPTMPEAEIARAIQDNKHVWLIGGSLPELAALLARTSAPVRVVERRCATKTCLVVVEWNGREDAGGGKV